QQAGAVLLRTPGGGAAPLTAFRAALLLERRRGGRALVPARALRGDRRRIGRDLRSDARLRDLLAARADPHLGHPPGAGTLARGDHDRARALERLLRLARRRRRLRAPG